MTQTRERKPPVEPSDPSRTVQLLVEDAGNRSAISGMLEDRFDVEASQTVTGADLYLIEDHLFAEYRAALREQVEREDPAFCPIVLIRRESTDLRPSGEGSAGSREGVRYDEVVDAPIDPPQLIRRLNSLLVRRQQSLKLMQQVTTLEKREQRLRLFEQGIESTGNGIVMTDSEGTIEYVNPALESIVGYTEADVLGESPQILLPQGTGDVFDAEFWQTLRDREEWEGDIIVEGKDSHRLVVNATATALLDSHDETQGFVIVIKDITERIQREQDLEDRETELDLLRQILMRYLRHNLRNDLNVIQGNAALLKEDESLSQRQIESAETIIENSEDLLEMSDTARTYSTLLERDAELSPYDLSEIATDAVQNVRESHPDVNFEIDVPETCDIRAREGIQRAFEELIDNAARHNDTTDPWVRIQVRDNDGALMVIEDNGPGIPDQERESLEKGGETPLTHSQGVGLWLSKWMIEGVDGQLSVELTDTGTRVTADFPPISKVGSTSEEISTLKERERRLQTITDRMTDAIIEVNADWNVTLLDDRAERIFDVEGDTVIGQRFWDVFPDLRDSQFEAVVRNVMESRSSTSVEQYGAMADAWLEFNVYPEFGGGLSIYTREVTERKQNEKKLERFKNAVDHAGHAVYVTDSDGTIEYVNPAFESITGYRANEAVGRNPRILKSGEMSDEYYEELWETLLDGTVWEEEVINRRQDGKLYTAHQTIAPILDENDDIHEFVAIQTDVTDRREQEEALQKERDRLDQFANVVSHDLRNPLNVTQGRIILAQEECDTVHLNAAASGVERSLDLIEDMLELAKAGQTVSEREPVAVANLADVCWDTVETADAELRVDFESTLRADRSRLQQLLGNLFRNAVEHVREDVTVRIGSLAEGIYVEDDGPGIPQDEWEEVWESGYSGSDDGSGFGLAIVKQIVEAHGWDIRITDGSDGGARFEITGVEVVAE